MLKPQDLLVALHLASTHGESVPTFLVLAHELSMSTSEVHASVKRAATSGLLDETTRKPNLATKLEAFASRGKGDFYHHDWKT